MDLLHLMNLIRQERTCRVLPAHEQPVLPDDVFLPGDLREFYQLCGGVYLFEAQGYGIKIVEPYEMRRADPVVAGVEDEVNISFNWFIIGHAPELGQYISIDLSKTRKGWCYDSFWETHGQPGNMPVVAHSFTGLLGQLLQSRGNRWYWLQNNFVSLGDAYD